MLDSTLIDLHNFYQFSEFHLSIYQCTYQLATGINLGSDLARQTPVAGTQVVNLEEQFIASKSYLEWMAD